MKPIPTSKLALTLDEIVEIQTALKEHWKPDERALFERWQKDFCNKLYAKLDAAKGPLVDRKRQAELKQAGAVRCPKCHRYMAGMDAKDRVNHTMQYECLPPEGCGAIVPVPRKRRRTNG